MPHPPGNEHRSLKDTSSWKIPPKDGEKRTAGRSCLKQQNRKAMGCRYRS
ncbi:MAG TPA: hypothetical protein PK766_07920 [Bacteroidales bacterium]|nr:hypothetical protein [Bacteroidales bacterium]